MAAEVTNGEKKKSQLDHRYRLVVMNDDTFAEIVSYRLTKMNLYLLVSSVLVLVVLLVVLAIFYTPLRQYVPGYGDINMRRELVEVRSMVDSLEEEISNNNVMMFSKKVQLSDDPAATESEEHYKQLPLDSNAQSGEPVHVTGIGDTLAMMMQSVGNREGGISEIPLSNVGNMFDPQSMNFVAPLSQTATVSQEFAPQRNHFGLDIADAGSTPVKAVLGGTVICATWSYQDGYMIGVQHKNNFVSFYKHNSTLLKKVGNVVKAGEAVAIIGNTGSHSSGPHLHFELWYNGSPVNPSDYIKF